MQVFKVIAVTMTVRSGSLRGKPYPMFMNKGTIYEIVVIIQNVAFVTVRK